MTQTANRTAYTLSIVTGALVALPALAAVAAWHLHFLPLMQWAPGSVPMQYNTALGLLLCAASFLLLPADRTRLAQLPAAAAVSLGLATLAEHLFALDLHIDQFFFTAWLVAAENVAPGRMAANTALCLVVAGLALLAIGARSTLRRYGALAVALAGSLLCSIALVALVGYLTNIESGYRWGHFSKMGANSAASLLIIGAGLIARALFDSPSLLRCRWTPPALVGGLTIMFTLLLSQAMLGEQRASQVRASQAAADQIGIRVRIVTESLVRAVTRLENRWPMDHSSPAAEWQSDAEAYLGDHPGLLAIEWLNESMDNKRVVPLGIDKTWSLRFLEIQGNALKAARGRQTAVASDIVDVGPGKKGFLIVAPGPGSGRRSYTTAVLELEPWLVSIIGQQAALRYSVVVTAGGAEVYRRGAANSQMVPTAEAQSAVSIAGSTWKVRTWPGPEALSASESPLAIGVLVVGLLMAALLALTTHLIRSAREHAESLEEANRNMEVEIHERRLLEESLLAARGAAEEATRAKSDFLARMSHEIRTPMNAILGMASLLWESQLDPEQRQYVSAFRRAGDNLLTLINDILDLSKIEAGRIDLQSVDFELDELVAAVLDLMRVRADDKGLDIGCELSAQIHRALRGDPDRLRQILINLLGNAIKFTKMGQVCLRIDRELVQADGFQMLRFSVSDTGPGIPLDKQSLIFETFSQADSSISRQYGGTGLGLTIARQIVERMGGRLGVKSISGKGSTFSFALPFALSAERAPRPDSAGALPAAPPERRLNILLVEDSRDNQLLISAYLKQTAKTLEIAADGQAAVEKFTAGRFDLVLMDVQMPVMDGYTATRTIREWEASHCVRKTPILALSAHAMEDALEKSLAAGCDAHLTKPIRKATLLQAIAEHCQARVVTRDCPSKEIEELVPWYLEKRRADLVALAVALQAGDYDAICVLGHNMKGSGAGYGFDAITKIGAALEAAAKKKSDGPIGTEISALGDFLDRVVVVSG